MVEPRFYAGNLCLDFANTVEPRSGTDGEDLVPDYAALARWSRDAGIVDSAAYEDLLTTADRHPKTAATAHARSIVLREALYRTFASLANHQDPRERDLALVHAAYLEALRHGLPRMTGDGLTWTWASPGLAYPRWRMAVDAVELLKSPDLDRVKSCHQPCGWLFVDRTKNRSRRWCSMRECGFGEKARLQAERRRLRSGS
jgi:predicted RNA-binding Zn ribbon-like protein